PPVLDLRKFCSANEMDNVTLVFGNKDKKLRVAKELLAIHSPIFAAMFSDHAFVKDIEDVKINDVIYKDFIDLLQLIYPRVLEISDRSVSRLLMLAYRLKMQCVLHKSENHLIKSTGFNV
ncbi:hypothetical protein PMAYCL1PPCAC_01634, partial [Pristionchus mayeri]